MNKQLIRLQGLFSAVDHGIVTIPDEVIALRAGLDRLTAAAPVQPENPSTVKDRLTGLTIQAAVDGIDLPGVGAVEQAQRAIAEHETQAAVIRDAIEQLGDRLGHEVKDMGSTIITEHLQPAFAKALAELTAALATTARFDDDPLAALNAPPKDRAAFAAIPQLHATMTAITAARTSLRSVGVVASVDINGDVGSAKNLEDVYPRMQRGQARPPWPEDANDRRTWLIRHGAQLWMPTPAEQDARYQEIYGEADAQELANRQNLRGYREMYTAPSGRSLVRASE